jgi:glycosyltransferase involved in cell wall biosynthesis
MRIAILGTRGIPNNYGGFEQFAENLALGLVKRGYEVLVYNSHNHPYQKSEWNGVQLIHIHDPEHQVGTVGQFVYDFKCIIDLRKRECDIVLQLGYSSSSVWGWLLPKNLVVTTNMDGLEWKRTKYSAKVKKFLLYAEKCAVNYSDHLISDSIGIQNYLRKKYHVDSYYIPYGANIFVNPETSYLNACSLEPYNYDLLVARLEPENSIETILDGVAQATLKKPFLVIGNYKTAYGKFLMNKYKAFKCIQFLGGIYNLVKLNNLRYYSNLYFHGHTVGGTNPSLLEAMASGSLISAHDNDFNKYILGKQALYFKKPKDVSDQLLMVDKSDGCYKDFVDLNACKITDIYTWERITDQYDAHFQAIRGVVKR